MLVRRFFRPVLFAAILPTAVPAMTSELAGTAWRLLNIASMDDRVDTADAPSKYTLEFGADGSAAMTADCNRGTGSWTSESASQLQFGPIAATRALCPPGSLADKYLAQFEWVRSYVLKGGHLFLATMADGSIIEFEPLDATPPAATVLGTDVHATDAGKMQQIVLSRLFDQYAEAHGVEAADSEVEQFIVNLKRGLEAEGLNAEADLTPAEAAQVDGMRQQMARSVIRQWKINRTLYREYGGRIIGQQFGPEPLDAYRRFLEERQQAGAFTIHEKSFADAFWRYFKDDSMHSFIPVGEESGAFEVPPWVQLSHER